MTQSANVPLLIQFLEKWRMAHGLSENFLLHGLLIFVALIVASIACRFWISPWADEKIRQKEEGLTAGSLWIVLTKRLSLPVIWLLLLWIADGMSRHYGVARGWFYFGEILLLTWIVSRLIITIATALSLGKIHQVLMVLVTLVLWLMALLEISDLLSPILAILDNIDMHLGTLRISLLHLLWGGLLSILFLWLSRAVTSSFSAWIETVPKLSPSFQTLSQKLFAVGFYTLAIVLVLGGLGINLRSFAWFSGAIGLGLGFGLQKVVSNLASGFIILADKSIKPGDVIQVGETYGWINYLGNRYVSVITRDGIEYLIPNEELIIGKVINWSYSQNLVRLKIPVGIAYGSDLELAMQLMLDAAKAVPRVLTTPEPSCRLMGFGDSSINFQLRVWINDPKNGIHGVTSDVSLEIWRRFQEHDIEIPFPQRVLYHKSVPEITVKKEA
ncbi:MAG: mechanosensitive ion channel family protein [Desulfobaccales bacterium]